MDVVDRCPHAATHADVEPGAGVIALDPHDRVGRAGCKTRDAGDVAGEAEIECIGEFGVGRLVIDAEPQGEAQASLMKFCKSSMVP